MQQTFKFLGFFGCLYPVSDGREKMKNGRQKISVLDRYMMILRNLRMASERIQLLSLNVKQVVYIITAKYTLQKC